jgi:hypothetical protein
VIGACDLRERGLQQVARVGFPLHASVALTTLSCFTESVCLQYVAMRARTELMQVVSRRSPNVKVCQNFGLPLCSLVGTATIKRKTRVADRLCICPTMHHRKVEATTASGRVRFHPERVTFYSKAGEPLRAVVHIAAHVQLISPQQPPDQPLRTSET